jgi:hypothetical protein
MAQSSTFTIGKTSMPRSYISFGSIDFLNISTYELCLTKSNTPATVSVGGPTRCAATRIKVEK